MVGDELLSTAYQMDGEPNDEVQLANALLISSAPELLSALRFALESLGDPVDTDRRLAAVIQANNAISKATGK